MAVNVDKCIDVGFEQVWIAFTNEKEIEAFTQKRAVIADNVRTMYVREILAGRS